MPAGTWQTYDKFPHLATELLPAASFRLSTASYKMALFLSTSNASDLDNDELADLTNQHANANGYVTGGFALATPTVTQVVRDAKLSFADETPALTASGGNVVFRWKVIYVVGAVGALTNPLVAVSLADTTGGGGDFTVPSGDALNIFFTNGVYFFRGTV